MKVLLIEDDPKIARFLQKGLQESGYVVNHVSDGEEGLLMMTSTPHDVVILDLMLPKVDGLQVLNLARAQGVTTPVLILSAKRSVQERVEGLQHGGDDYLVKPFAFSELLARLQVLLRRNTQAKAVPSTLKSCGFTMDLLTREVHRDGKLIELQTKEFALLEYLLRNPGRILSKTLILENVYHYNFDPQTNVVDVLVCRLRNKVDKDFDVKTIHTIRGVGYVLKAE